MNDTSLETAFGIEYKILKLIVEHQKDTFYLREIAKELKVPPMTIHRALNKLVKINILKSNDTGYKKYFTLNKKYLITPLKIIINLDNPIISELLKKLKSKSKLVLLYGSRAKGENDPNSDWDFIIVSDKIQPVQLNKIISVIENKWGGNVYVKHYTSRLFNELKKKEKVFYQEVIGSNIVLHGELE